MMKNSTDQPMLSIWIDQLKTYVQQQESPDSSHRALARAFSGLKVTLTLLAFVTFLELLLLHARLRRSQLGFNKAMST